MTYKKYRSGILEEYKKRMGVLYQQTRFVVVMVPRSDSSMIYGAEIVPLKTLSQWSIGY